MLQKSIFSTESKMAVIPLSPASRLLRSIPMDTRSISLIHWIPSPQWLLNKMHRNYSYVLPRNRCPLHSLYTTDCTSLSPSFTNIIISETIATHNWFWLYLEIFYSTTLLHKLHRNCGYILPIIKSFQTCSIVGCSASISCRTRLPHFAVSHILQIYSGRTCSLKQPPGHAKIA